MLDFDDFYLTFWNIREGKGTESTSKPLTIVVD